MAANAPVPETTPADGWGSLAGAPLVIAGWTLFVLMAVVWVAVEIDARSRTQLAHHEYEGLLFWLAIPMVMLGRSISRLDITLRRLIR